MEAVTLQNYRCFREKQVARLAPLTLLVGENSTGKTSFFALIRALWDVAFRNIVPDFREPPYDLGTFLDIAHSRGGRGGKSQTFEAGFTYQPTDRHSFHFTFENQDGIPFPTKRYLASERLFFEVRKTSNGEHVIRFGDPEDAQEHSLESRVKSSLVLLDEVLLVPLEVLLSEIRRDRGLVEEETRAAKSSKAEINRVGDVLLDELRDLFFSVWLYSERMASRPFAGAPVRSSPHRTYDPSRPSRDPGGEYIPTYLANVSRGKEEEWERLQRSLNEFGRSSGLFDEISIKHFGRTEGSPFQVQIRKATEGRKGAQRNLIDVGYGVSQVLPVLTELLREDASSMLLLQQPEVHLHPKAQAALGSLFCSAASQERQLIVETHSDYIIDRVRMDIRDGSSELKPEDVSILYFERSGIDVNIHSLRIDEEGNVLDAPPGYGQFFMDEVTRSIGL